MARSLNHSGSTGYIPVIDGLRALAIFLVLLSHLTIYNQSNSSILAFGLICGQLGVSSFFIISGYLITLLLLREENNARKVNLKTFYIRRALRIFPAFYVHLVILILLWQLGLLTSNPPHSFIASALYLRNFIGQGHETAHHWSLSLEEQFYVLWPFILVSSPVKQRFSIVLGIIFAVVIWRTCLVFLNGADIGALYTRTDLRIDTILIGCSLAIIETYYTNFNRNSLWSKRWLLYSTFILLIAYLCFSSHIPHVATVNTTVQAFLLCIIINCFLNDESSNLSLLLQSQMIRLIGQLSYSLYIWQQLFLGPLTSETLYVRVFPVNLMLTVVFALLSYWLVEKPFLKLKNTHFSRK